MNRIFDNLRIGTCSWKYDSWQGIVYSQPKPANYLEEYAARYRTVEIDQWFWSLFGVDKIALPSPRVVEEYLNSVPKDFTFTIKVPNSLTLTHFYRKSKNEPLVTNPHFLSVDLFEQFLDSILPLKNRVGALMFQFEYLNRQKMPSQKIFQEKCAAFIDRLSPEFPCTFEIRNPNYLNLSYFRFLQSHHLGAVFLQGYYMPPVWEIYPKFRSLLTGTTVIRLHGATRGEIEQKSGGNWNRILEPKDEELVQITRMIRDLLKQNLKVYVNVNNHYEGSAPLTIRRLQKILSADER